MLTQSYRMIEMGDWAQIIWHHTTAYIMGDQNIIKKGSAIPLTNCVQTNAV